MRGIVWGSGATCPDPECGHLWSQHAIEDEAGEGISCHGSDRCVCFMVRMGALVPLEQLRQPAPQEYRVGGDMLATLDAVAVAARNLFEALQQATRLALRQPPAPLATECRHCGRALQLGPTPGQDPLRFASVSWLDAGGSASCYGRALGAQDPGTYVPHEPMPRRSDPTGLPLHRCPGCQMLHPYPLAEEV